MQLTTPQTPQDDEFAALRNGLNGFNETMTGQLLSERITSFTKDKDERVRGGILANGGCRS
ncbi:hypothetical protein [Aeromonas sobria]|uniref:hypothetical protein n=1 Tax=Aeromonas sobria TaxID=646 RepID=UPI001875A5FB|nr:hypothetical protein [Aeromonas sobria]